MSANPNLAVVTTDWHLVPDDSTPGGLGETYPKEAYAVVEHIVGMEPAGCIDMGDCKDHYVGQGPSLSAEHANYKKYVQSRIPWFPVNAPTPGNGVVNATDPILPGNHDESDDYTTPDNGVEFAPFDSNFWAAPYHWTCDWTAPKIRFIAFHAYIIHDDPNVDNGYFQMDSAELTWLTNELAALPSGWKAIVCCHPAMLATFGNEIKSNHGGTALLALLAANNTKIAACLGGHRHLNEPHAVQDSILHISCMSVAYTAGNQRGGFTLIEYLPGSNALRFHARYGPATDSFYGPVDPSVYTPQDVAL